MGQRLARVCKIDCPTPPFPPPSPRFVLLAPFFFCICLRLFLDW
jgi:hypothetical protein